MQNDENLSMDDEKGNCKQCGHPFDPHLVIAWDREHPEKWGIIKCSVAHCPCHSIWDFDQKQKMNELVWVGLLLYLT